MSQITIEGIKIGGDLQVDGDIKSPDVNRPLQKYFKRDVPWLQAEGLVSSNADLEDLDFGLALPISADLYNFNESVEEADGNKELDVDPAVTLEYVDGKFDQAVRVDLPGDSTQPTLSDTSTDISLPSDELQISFLARHEGAPTDSQTREFVSLTNEDWDISFFVRDTDIGLKKRGPEDTFLDRTGSAIHTWRLQDIRIASNGKGFAITRSGAISHTENYGYTFQDVPNLSGFSRGRGADLRENGVGAAIHDQESPGFWLTTDYGETWQSKTLGNNKLSTVSISSNGLVLVGGRDRYSADKAWEEDALLQLSTDYGDNWQDILSNLPSTLNLHNGASIHTVYAGDDGVCLVAAENGIARSTDSGSSWSMVHTDSGATFGNRYQIKMNGDNGVIAIDSNSHSSRVLYTTDRGQTWNQANTSVMSGGVSTFSEIDDNDEVWAMGDDFQSVYRSTDSGETWEDKSSLNPFSTFLSLDHFISSVSEGPGKDSIVYIGGDDGHVGVYDREEHDREEIEAGALPNAGDFHHYMLYLDGDELKVAIDNQEVLSIDRLPYASGLNPHLHINYDSYHWRIEDLVIATTDQLTSQQIDDYLTGDDPWTKDVDLDNMFIQASDGADIEYRTTGGGAHIFTGRVDFGRFVIMPGHPRFAGQNEWQDSSDFWPVFKIVQKIHFGMCLIETNEAGQFTLDLMEYDEGDVGSSRATRVFQLEDGINYIDLDITIPDDLVGKEIRLNGGTDYPRCLNVGEHRYTNFYHPWIEGRRHRSATHELSNWWRALFNIEVYKV